MKRVKWSTKLIKTKSDTKSSTVVVRETQFKNVPFTLDTWHSKIAKFNCLFRLFFFLLRFRFQFLFLIFFFISAIQYSWWAALIVTILRIEAKFIEWIFTIHTETFILSLRRTPHNSLLCLKPCLLFRWLKFTFSM